MSVAFHLHWRDSAWQWLGMSPILVFILRLLCQSARSYHRGTLAKMTPPRIAACRLPFHLHRRDLAWHRPAHHVIHSTLHLLPPFHRLCFAHRQGECHTKQAAKQIKQLLCFSISQTMYVVGRCRIMAGLGRHGIGWRRCFCLIVSCYYLFMSFLTDPG